MCTALLMPAKASGAQGAQHAGHFPRPSVHRPIALWPAALPPPAAFEGVRPEQLSVRCLRKKAYMSDWVLGAAMDWFNALCVDDADLPAFREWQQLVDPAAAAAMAAGEGAAGGDWAARAAAAAAEEAERRAAVAEQEPEDFWALQADFYREDDDRGQQREAQQGGADEAGAAAR